MTKSGKHTPLKPTSEKIFISTQECQIDLQEAKEKESLMKSSIKNCVEIMRQVKSLQEEGFSKEEILGMIPEAKGMLHIDS